MGLKLSAQRAVVHYQEGEGEAEGGSLAGTGIALGIIGLVLLLLAVVAVIGRLAWGLSASATGSQRAETSALN